MKPRILCQFTTQSVFAAMFATFAVVFSSHSIALAFGPNDSSEMSPHADRRPNIVLIVADDLGINDLNCYGRSEHATPHLNRLASQGIRFTSAYCALPICSASRAGLMTSKYPARLHLTTYLPGRPDAASQPLLQARIQPMLRNSDNTLAEELKRAGYVTGLFGKWHLGSGASSPAAQGFDVVFEPNASGTPGEREGGKNEFTIADKAIEFIQANRERPFFCYVPHHIPHIDLRPDPEIVKRNNAAWNPEYAATIESMDQSVGRILETLTSEKLDANTIVLFTSDNGGLHVPEGHATPVTHNSPYRAGKGYLYEGGLRVPLIVRWPGLIQPNQTVHAPVSLLDIMPTLLDSIGVDTNKTVGPLDGVSQKKVWLSVDAFPITNERAFYWHSPHYTNQGSRPSGAVRKGKWKYIVQYDTNTSELFDLESDVGELKNVADQNAEVAKSMAADLERWKLSVGAQENVPNPAADQALHRQIYLDHDPSLLAYQPDAKALGQQWKSWRQAMNQAIAGKQPILKATQNEIVLNASAARPHGKNLRYEPETYKNVLGYWTEVGDWADWETTIPAAGQYDVEVHVGCGGGHGGSRASIVAGNQTLEWDVRDTGHFQNIIIQHLGTVTLAEGAQTVEVRPIKKAGVAVMDVRAVILRPKANDANSSTPSK